MSYKNSTPPGPLPSTAAANEYTSDGVKIEPGLRVRVRVGWEGAVAAEPTYHEGDWHHAWDNDGWYFIDFDNGRRRLYHAQHLTSIKGK